MRLTDKHIAEYQRLYLQTFGEHISKEDALAQGLALIRLVKALAQRSTNAEHDHEDQLSGTQHPGVA